MTTAEEYANQYVYQALPTKEKIDFFDMREAEDLDSTGAMEGDAESTDREGTEAESAEEEDGEVTDAESAEDYDEGEGTCYDTDLLVTALGNLTEELKEIKQEMVYLMYTVTGCCAVVAACALL